MIRRILVPLDGSPMAERALPHATALARAFDASVVLLQVMAAERRMGRAQVDSAEWRLRRLEAEAYLEHLAGRLSESGLQASSGMAEGNVAEQILGEARRRQADQIVLSTHGRSGPSEFGLGGTAAKVLARAGLSVLVVRAAGELSPAGPEQGLRYGRVVVAVDCSHRSDWALHLAARLARSNESELRIAHVVPVPVLIQHAPATPKEARLIERIVEANRAAARSYLDEMVAKLAAPDLEVTSSLIVSESVPQSIDDLARSEGAGLVVASAHGASGGSRWPYGSVSGMLIDYGTTPLLIFQDLTRPVGEESVSAAGAAVLTGNGWPR